jgi:hypothetical protein
MQGLGILIRLEGGIKTGVQSKNNAYHIIDKIHNSSRLAVNFIFIDIVVCVVFALHSRIIRYMIFFINYFKSPIFPVYQIKERNNFDEKNQLKFFVFQMSANLTSQWLFWQPKRVVFFFKSCLIFGGSIPGNF